MATLKCPRCGTSISVQWSNFCTKCGTPVGDGPVDTPLSRVSSHRWRIVLAATVATIIVVSILLVLAGDDSREQFTSYDRSEIVLGTAIDMSGNLWVAGIVRMRATGVWNSPALLVKYDNDGQVLWSNELGNRSEYRWFREITIDAAGSAYIVGDCIPSECGKAGQLTVRKYNNDGNEVWVRRLAGNNLARVELVVAKDLYVVITNLGSQTALVVKYDSDGKELWDRRLNAGPEWEGYFNNPHATIDDAEGLVLVLGREHTFSTVGFFGENWSSVSLPPVMWRYDGNGDLLFGPEIMGRNINGNSTTLNKAGNLYVAGFGSKDAPGNNVVKYDTGGNEVWKRKLASSPGGVTTDGAGNVYIRGFGGPEFNNVVKYDNDGNEVWIRGLDSPPQGVITDAAGNVFLVEGRDVVKLDSDGNDLWAIELVGAAHQVTTGPTGDVYVVDPHPVEDVLKSDVIKYDVNGNEVWRREVRFPDGPGVLRTVSTPVP